MTQEHSSGTLTRGLGDHDFDLHGIVGIRLLDATAADIAKVRRQLGPLDRPLERAPDITVRFVDTATVAPLTHVGLDGGYNADGFFVRQLAGRTTGSAKIPFADIGFQPEIVCERSLPAVPHLLALINLTALANGVLPLHASAYTFESTGVLVTGWAKGGKSESLLASVRMGATYVGDEWVYLTPDGQMHGLPERIRLWAWHLSQLPEIVAARPRRERARLRTWETLDRLASSAGATGLPGSALARKAAPVIGRQAYLQIAPTEMFGPQAVSLHGDLDAVVLVVSHDSPDIVTSAISAAEVAARMAASLVDERARFLTQYHQFRFAFPDLRNTVVDTAETVESALLLRLLDGRPAARVAHPYPCDVATLGEAVNSAALAAVRAAATRADPDQGDETPQ